jgi:protein-tyrosine phosphatase
MIIVPVIPNRLYAGGKLDQQGWRFIAQNINTVINLRTEQDHPPFFFIGRLMLWTPILDAVPPNLHWVITVTNLMNGLLDTGNKIYVHDTAGINRLGFILTAFFMRRFGYSRHTALTLLRQIKPDLNPNPRYMALLASFEQYLNTSEFMQGQRYGTC